MWDITNLQGVQKKGFAVITAARHWIIRNKKKGSLVNDIMLRMDEGIWKILIFRKMEDIEIVVYPTKISLTFSAIKKNNRPKKNTSSIRRTIIYKISEKNFKLIGQAVLKLQWSPTLKTWFREKRVQSFEYDLRADRDGSIQSHLSP